MSRWLDIAARDEVIPNPLTDTQQEPAKSRGSHADTPFLMVSAGCRGGKSGKGQSPNEGVENRPNPKIDPDIPAPDEPKITLRSETYPYGVSPGGRPLTFTGKVVSLDAWRELSKWEKHGPRGKVWNGASRKWEGVE